MPLDAGFHGLGLRILETLMANPGEFGPARPIEQIPSPPDVPGLPEFVLESEAGLVVGEPPARSLSLAVPIRGFDAPDGHASATGGLTSSTGDLTSWNCGPIFPADGLAWTFGKPPALAAAGGRTCDFLQLLIVTGDEPVSRPFLSSVSSLRSLAGRLPGYFAHSVGHETTARIHRDLLAAGLSHEHLAGAHLAQARARGFSGPVFVAVGIPSDRALELFAPFLDEYRTLTADLSAAAAAGAAGMAGASRIDGATDDRAPGCEGRTCSDCDDRDVCDKVRAVLKASSENQKERGAI